MIPVSKELPVSKARLVFRAPPVTKEIKVTLVSKETQAWLGKLVSKVFKVIQAFRARLECKVKLAFRERPVIRVKLVSKELPVYKVRLVFKERLEIKVIPVYRETQVFRVRQVSKVYKE